MSKVLGGMMTVIIQSIDQWQAIQKESQGKTIGLVPTMGNLHDGHMGLIRQSKRENDLTVVTCFVNPTQFNHAADLDAYPRTPEEDYQRVDSVGVDYLFDPDDQDLYPDDYHYRVTEAQLSRMMEGEHRPGHFDGVLTVVLKLLLLFRPSHVYFGEKDYQQLQLVKGLVKAFFLDTSVVACPTVRSDAGLALSSRNRRLSEKQCHQARLFPQYLQSSLSCQAIEWHLSQAGFRVDYIAEHEGRRYGAVFLGDVRLIDNVEVVSC